MDRVWYFLLNDLRPTSRIGSLINVVICGSLFAVGVALALAIPSFGWAFAIGALVLEVVFIGVFVWVRAQDAAR